MESQVVDWSCFGFLSALLHCQDLGQEKKDTATALIKTTITHNNGCHEPKWAAALLGDINHKVGSYSCRSCIYYLCSYSIIKLHTSQRRHSLFLYASSSFGILLLLYYNMDSCKFKVFIMTVMQKCLVITLGSNISVKSLYLHLFALCVHLVWHYFSFGCLHMVLIKVGFSNLKRKLPHVVHSKWTTLMWAHRFKFTVI